METEIKIIRPKLPRLIDEKKLELALDIALRGLDPLQQQQLMLEVMGELGRKELERIGFQGNSDLILSGGRNILD